MQEQLYTLIPLDGQYGAAPGLTIEEAFTRLMAVAERGDYMFFRTGGWVMHLVTSEKSGGEPEFESNLSVDRQARAEIMRKVCQHGLGLFRVIPDERFHSERVGNGRAA